MANKKKRKVNTKSKKNNKSANQEKGFDKDSITIAVIVCILLGAIFLTLILFLNEMNVGIGFEGILPSFMREEQVTTIAPTEFYEIVIEEYEVYYKGEKTDIDSLRKMMANDYNETVRFEVIDSNAIKSVYDKIVQIITDNGYNFREK